MIPAQPGTVAVFLQEFGDEFCEPGPLSAPGIRRYPVLAWGRCAEKGGHDGAVEAWILKPRSSSLIPICWEISEPADGMAGTVLLGFEFGVERDWSEAETEAVKELAWLRARVKPVGGEG